MFKIYTNGYKMISNKRNRAKSTLKYSLCSVVQYCTHFSSYKYIFKIVEISHFFKFNVTYLKLNMHVTAAQRYLWTVD